MSHISVFGFIFLIVLVLVVVLVSRKLFIKIRLGKSIKWIALGYVAVLLLGAILTSISEPTAKQVSAEQRQQMDAYNKQLLQQFNNKKMTVPEDNMWVQDVDTSEEYYIQENEEVRYKIVRSNKLTNTVEGKVYYLKYATKQMNLTGELPELIIDEGENEVDIRRKDMPTVKVLTDRLDFIKDEGFQVNDVEGDVFQDVLVLLEVPKNLKVVKE